MQGSLMFCDLRHVQGACADMGVSEIRGTLLGPSYKGPSYKRILLLGGFVFEVPDFRKPPICRG